MTKRRSLHTKTKDPRGPIKSKYAEKVRKERSQLIGVRPIDSMLYELPPQSELANVQITGVHLRNGFVLAEDQRRRRVYISDGIIDIYDPNAHRNVRLGSKIECAIIQNDRGWRAVKIFDISPHQ